MAHRIFNFSAGPAMLPTEVLEASCGALLDYQGKGFGIAECSHRGKEFDGVVDEAIAAHGRVHTVVWAAGPLVDQLMLSETPMEKWKRAIDVEVHGFFAATQTMLQHFRDSGGGSFVHLGSAGNLRWPDRDGLSVAPKAANESLVKGIAREEGKYGIRAIPTVILFKNGEVVEQVTGAVSKASLKQMLSDKAL